MLMWSKLELTFHEIEELKNIDHAGMLFAGDTISHQTANSLVKKGAAARIDGRFVCTAAGQKFLEQLDTVFKRKGGWV